MRWRDCKCAATNGYSIIDAFSRNWQAFLSTRSIYGNLSRVELGSGGSVRKTLSTGVDSLVTELLPRIVSTDCGSEESKRLTQFGEAGCTLNTVSACSQAFTSVLTGHSLRSAGSTGLDLTDL